MTDASRISEALIDVSEYKDQRVVTVAVLNGDGHELHTQISQPLDEEEAYWRLGNRDQALKNLGIPATLSERAEALRDWWEADRFVVLYKRYGADERDEHPTLEGAWKGADGISEMGSGAPYEIREVDGDRLLYEVRKVMEGWVRVADDVPPVAELEKTAEKT